MNSACEKVFSSGSVAFCTGSKDAHEGFVKGPWSHGFHGRMPRTKKQAGVPEFGKRDIVFLTALFLLGLGLTLCIYLFSSGGSEIRITVDGQLYGTYDLGKDQEISVKTEHGGENLIAVENGAAYMKAADCPDGLCMHQGRISRDKQTIVCLPHKLVVEAVGGQEQEYDAISR